MHTIRETIEMIQAHIDYIEYIKYSHTVNRIKQDETKLAHLRDVKRFLCDLKMDDFVLSDLREVFYL